MIKLQLLLRHPSADIALDPAVQAQLEGVGMTVTGSGRASVSAEMAETDFARLFGPVAPGADLPLPPQLADTIRLVTLPLRHSKMHPTPRVNHAAI